MLMTVDEFIKPEQLNAAEHVYGAACDFGYGSGACAVEGKACGRYYGYGDGNATGNCDHWCNGYGYGSGIGAGSVYNCGDGGGNSDGYGTGDCSGGH